MQFCKHFNRVLSLVLALVLVVGAAPVFSVTLSAGEPGTLPENVELQWPEVTGDTVGNLWHKFDEPAGSTVASISNPGSGRNTSNLTGHTFDQSAGVDGGAIYLDGAVDSRILLNNDNAAQTGTIHGSYQNASVAFWFKPERLTGEQVLLLWGGEQGNNTTSTGDIRGIGIRLNGHMLEAFVGTAQTNNTPPDRFTPVSVEGRENEWIHVAVTFGGASAESSPGTAKLYLDGVLKQAITTAKSRTGYIQRGGSMGSAFYATGRESGSIAGISGVAARATTAHSGFDPVAGLDNTTSTGQQPFKGWFDDLRLYTATPASQVVPKRVIQEFDPIPDIILSAATEQSNIGLPTELKAYLSQTVSETVTITGWTSDPPYDGEKANIYTFTAQVDAAYAVKNPPQVRVFLSANGEDPILNAAHAAASAYLEKYRLDATTTTAGVLADINAALADFVGVSASWKETPQFTAPAEGVMGVLKGTILLSKGTYTKDLAVDIETRYKKSGLILHYEFDEVDEFFGKPTAADSTINGFDAMGYGTLKTTAGVFGGAMFFSGGYVQVPKAVMEDVESLTVSVWICPLADRDNTNIFSFGSAGVTASNTSNYFNLTAPTGTSGSSRRYTAGIAGTGAGSRAQSPNGSYRAGEWTHLAVTYDEAEDGLVTLFVNGVEQDATQTGGRLSNIGDFSNLVLGRSRDDAVQPFDFYGYMDDFRIYDDALNPADISALTDAGLQSLVEETANRLDVADFNGFSKLDGVVQDLSLPDEGNNTFIKRSGAAVSWGTNNGSVIADDGTIGSDGTAKLTATVSRAGTDGNPRTGTAEFDLTVVSPRTRTPDPVEIITVPGAAPMLPERIPANNGKASVQVTWNAVDQREYAGAGAFTVSGTVAEGVAASANVVVDGTKFTNPIILPVGPDPYIYYHEPDGYYYYVKNTFGPDVSVARAKRFQDIGSVPLVSVFVPPTVQANYGIHFWAPEIYFHDGDWYIHFAPEGRNASGGATGNRRMWIAKSTDPDNAQAPFEMIEPRIAIGDQVALDGTVLTVEGDGPNAGKRYYIWVAQPTSAERTALNAQLGNNNALQSSSQLMYIAPMDTPYSVAEGSERILIGIPDTPYERKASGTPHLLEGAQILQKNGKIYLIYSNGQANYITYSICAFVADAGSDLLNPDSWGKTGGVLFGASLDADDWVTAPGHGMTTKSPDGTEDWLITHASPRHSNGGTNMQLRSARAFKLMWDGDMPVFPNPGPITELIDQPSGSVDQVALKYEAETADISDGSPTVRQDASGGRTVEITASSSVKFTVDIKVPGNYLVSFVAGTNSDHQGNENHRARHDVDIAFEGGGTESYVVTHRRPGRDLQMDAYHASFVENDLQMGMGLYVDFPVGTHTINVSRNSTYSGSNVRVELDYLYLLLNEDPADKTALKEVIAQAKLILDGGMEGMDPDNWKSLETAYRAAQSADLNGGISQRQADGAKDRLLAALPAALTSVSVSTPTIVETLSANLRISVTGERLEGRTLTAYLSVDGELDESTATDITSGTALMKIAAAPALGADCKVVVKVDGIAIEASFTMTLAAYNPATLWNPSLIVNEDGYIAALFSEDIGPANKGGYTAKVNGTACRVTQSGRTLVTDVLAGESLTDVTVVLTGVKYPVLFPSYSFTFTVRAT